MFTLAGTWYPISVLIGKSLGTVQRRSATMPPRRAVLLTGATGLLGQYLLRDLLAQGEAVAVLVRDSEQEKAAERIVRIISFWSEQLHKQLPTPVVLNGELDQTALGLT